MRYVREILVSALLAMLALGAYWHGCENEFVNYDDQYYVELNSHVIDGLIGPNVRWAWMESCGANWHPLTMLSLQLDAHLFGLDPRAFHRTNILLHTANVVVLFLALRWLTGALWRSAAVAAFFALHPLHVESVAWISERKDVLSALFFLLAVLAYAWYRARPGLGRYLVVMIAFALGLLSKAMVVTLPFVLLLLDYWPLGRWAKAKEANSGNANSLAACRRAFGVAVAEKVPLLVMAAIFSVVAWRTQQQWKAVQSLDDISFGSRVGNAIFGYTVYLRKTIWPVDLAPFYPHPRTMVPLATVALAAGLLAALSVFIFRQHRQLPYLAVGWLWFLGMLVPVIGLVQVGNQALADRFTYLPHVGLFVLFVWGLAELGSRWHCQEVMAFLLGILLAPCALLTWLQVLYWHDSVRLWEHALQVAPPSSLAHYCLGSALEKQVSGVPEAIHHFEAALKLDPKYAMAHLELGRLFASMGRVEEAISHFHAALEVEPTAAMLHLELGRLFVSMGRIDEGISHFHAALEVEPTAAMTHNNLGVALTKQRKWREGIEHFQAALAVAPNCPGAHYNLGVALAEEGNREEAILHFEAALGNDPEDISAVYNLGMQLQARGRITEAERQYRVALARAPDHAVLHFQLGRVLARQAKLEEAIASLRQAVRLQPTRADFHAGLAFVLQKQNHFGEAGTEYRTALRLDPNWVESTNRKAWEFATRLHPGMRHGALALELAQQVCQATDYRDPRFLDTLAVAHAEMGEYQRAVALEQQALVLVTEAGEMNAERAMKARLRLFENCQPFHIAR